jgi:hypothetical protein
MSGRNSDRDYVGPSVLSPLSAPGLPNGFSPQSSPSSASWEPFLPSPTSPSRNADESDNPPKSGTEQKPKIRVIDEVVHVPVAVKQVQQLPHPTRISTDLLIAHRKGIAYVTKGGDIAMAKNKRNIKVVPVWRESVDRTYLVQALLAFVAQLDDESKKSPKVETGEASND